MFQLQLPTLRVNLIKMYIFRLCRRYYLNLFISDMDVAYVFAAAIIVLGFILLYKTLYVFYGLSSSSGRSSVVLGFYIQLNSERVGDP